MEPFYRTSFSRHRHSLVVNGFYTRELDADDFAFLEYVKERGIANGSLPNTSAVLIEELEFWHLPYTIAPDVERHVGRRPRSVETEEQRAARKARTSVWHAQRTFRARERAVADLELEREKREWEEANKQRKVRELISDLEWAAFAPRTSKFGATVGRHYVPQWRLDEARAAVTERRKRKSEKSFTDEAVLTEVRRRKANNARRAEWAAAEAEAKAAELAATHERNLKEEHARRAQQIEQEQARRERQLQEARETLERVKQLEREHGDVVSAKRYTSETLQQAILIMMTQSQHALTVSQMMRALGCEDKALMDFCLLELRRKRKIKISNSPKP